MEDHKPEWYAQARKGPFGNDKFTTHHADNVMRQIQGDQQRRKSHSGKRLRVQMLTAVSFILLLGVFFLSGRPFGHEPNEARQGAGSSQFTEAELQQTAEQAMQDILGKSHSLDHKEWLVNQQQIFFSYQIGEESAYIWINYETGELVRAEMSAILTTAELDAELLTQAEEVKAKLGFAGDPDFEVLRYAEYDAAQDSVTQIANNFKAGKWRIGFVNGEFDYASATLEASAVPVDARQAGDTALKLLRGSGDTELKLAFRAIGEDGDTLTLNYGSEALVTLDTATNKVQQVSDINLKQSEQSDAGDLTFLDRKLSNVDGDPLREKAALLLDKIFGIVNVDEYSFVKKGEEPGNLTFHKLGNPEITVYYDSDLTIWKMELDSAANKL